MVFLVVGDVNVDLHASLERFPREGDDVAISGLGYLSGGSAANVATGIARFSGRARLYSRIGVDPSALIAVRAAQNAGVDLSCLQEDRSVPTGFCFAAISPGGERTFFSSRGANVLLEYSNVEALWRDVSHLHIAGHALLDDPQSLTTLRMMEEAQRRACTISLDLCLPLLRRCPEKVLDRLPSISTLFANELELGAIAATLGYGGGVGDAVRFALEALVSRGSTCVVGKLGARGSVVAMGSARMEIPPFAIDALDTTGAGDAYVAAFLYAQARGASVQEAASFGNAAGSLLAQRLGAAEAMPGLDEVLKRNRGSSFAWEPEVFGDPS